jgi:predicted  nucleic acid-binding Zn-ribbon protein
MVKQCARCQRWFNSGDSRTCDPCWEELGQMSLDLADDEYQPDVDSVFDRMEEREGRQ